MSGEASGAGTALEMLWSIVGHAEGAIPQGSPVHTDLRAIAHSAARERALPDDAFMEKLERKAAIARILHAGYSKDWRPEGGPADSKLLVRAAALLMVDAVQAMDRARALKRLNAVFWIMDSERWDAGAPGAQDLARIVDERAAALASWAAP